MTGDERWLETARLAELGMLCAELVHEIRQPLFAARAQLQVVQARAGERERAGIETALAQLAHLQRVLERYDLGRQPADGRPRPLLLAPAVADGVELMRARARGRGRALRFDVEPGLRVVRADPVAVRQVAANLVANALDAARTAVEVRVDGARFTVRDDGDGIDSAVRERIFEPFFSTKPPAEGTGLGLAISRRLVQRYGGELRFTTGATGTTFEVRFPVDDGGGEAG